MRIARLISQGVFLCLFLFLFIETESKGTDSLTYPARLFLDFDPLLLFTTVLSGHALAKGLLLSLGVLGLTAVLGRVFCGWVCPLGTLNSLAAGLRKWPARPSVRGWFQVKYYVLAFLLGSSLFGMQLVGFFDPLCVLVRSLTLGVYPAFNYAANAAMDAAVSANIHALTLPTEFIYNLLKKSVLAFQQPYFFQGTLVSAIFLLILAANLLERRFWCRYLCPLGALLGLVGRWAPLKRKVVAQDCNHCGLCERNCQGASECMACMNCTSACPKQAISWGLQSGGSAVEAGRRNFLRAGLSGAAAVAMSRATPAFKDTRPHPMLRPPGARPEAEFLSKCVRCGECMKVCTTNGLQPVGLELGLEGLWTPKLVPQQGYCEFNCTLCGQVCPTQAILRLTLEEKQKVKIGTAMFDHNRCLPWAHATPCIVCEEMCPVPDKAIWYETVQVRNRQGQTVEVKQPRVDLEKCIGCGACEAKCPLVDSPAVRVTSIGESRSPKNQILVTGGESPY